MNKQSTPHTCSADVRRLASRYDGQAIERYLQWALGNQANSSYQASDSTEAMNVLANIGFVVGQM